MNTVLDVSRFLHVVCGSICLLSGLVAIATPKGKRHHRLSGKLYFGSMAGVALTAITITLVRPSQLLLSLGVFSFYLSLVGYRSLAHKRLHRGEGVTALDWTSAFITIVFSAVLFVTGLVGGAQEGVVTYVTSIFFGILGVLLVSANIVRIARPKRAAKGSWLLQHIIYMMSSYIAVATAFIVTALKVTPPIVGWIGPSLVGTIIIVAMTSRYQKDKPSRT